MADKRPAVNRRGIGKKATEALERANPGQRANVLGIGGDKSLEPIPKFIQASSENVLTNGQNSWIVLGRDRPANLVSGHGGSGDTGAASIDLVVGRLSANPIAKTKDDEDIYVDPDFKRDAARIYLSQLTDIDKNFDLEKYARGSGNLENRSGVGIKADGVRIVGREGVKIVSGGDPINSQNAKISELVGIDLIVYGQDYLLQPLVKGENLMGCLASLSEEVDKLAAVVKGMLTAQTQLNKAFVKHFHQSPFFEMPTTTSIVAEIVGPRTLTAHAEITAPDIDTVRKSLGKWREKYLTDNRSYDYICSRHNNTT
jgi:hypothetical protein